MRHSLSDYFDVLKQTMSSDSQSTQQTVQNTNGRQEQDVNNTAQQQSTDQGDNVDADLAAAIEECRKAVANGNPIQAKDMYQKAREFYMNLKVSEDKRAQRYYELNHLFEQVRLKLLEQKALLRLKGKV